MQPVDYAWLVLTLLVTLFGLIRGFSGVFAFLVGTLLAAGGTAFAWHGFMTEIEPAWIRVAAAIVFAILVFALIRLTVSWIVGKMLAQPADSIFGVCLGLFCGAFLMWTMATYPALRDYSFLAGEVHAYLR